MFYLTDAEWEVMDVLWDGDEMSFAEITASLKGKGSSWAQNTVHTFLTRLERKGAVHIEKTASPHRYRALYERSYCERKEIDHMKRTMFRGSALRMLSALLGTEQVTDKEAGSLKAYIARMRESEDRNDR